MSERQNRGRPPKGEKKRELGLRIVAARRRHGWSQKDLAQRLTVTRERLGKWERGLSSPDLEDLVSLSRVLALPLWELGLGDAPINQGPMNIGYLVELACRAGGGPQALRRIAVRLHGSVFAGDRVECTATVAAVDEPAGGAELELRATAGGRDVLSGSATIATR